MYFSKEIVLSCSWVDVYLFIFYRMITAVKSHIYPKNLNSMPGIGWSWVKGKKTTQKGVILPIQWISECALLAWTIGGTKEKVLMCNGSSWAVPLAVARPVTKGAEKWCTGKNRSYMNPSFLTTSQLSEVSRTHPPIISPTPLSRPV